MKTRSQWLKTSWMQQKKFKEGSTYLPSYLKNNLTILPQETRKLSNKQSNLTLSTTKERRTNKPKVNGQKEIIEIRAERNEIETKKANTKINDTKSCFFEKIDIIDKPLARFIKKKRERTQINKIRNEKGKDTMHTIEIEKIIRDYCEQIYATIGH